MKDLTVLKDENKKFYKTLFALCLPIIAQNLISSSINIVDTVMVGGLGEAAVASIGVANQFFFLFNMALGGIVGGAGVFIAQFYGKQDVNSIRKVTALSVISAVLLSLFFTIPALFFPKAIINLFSDDKNVVTLAINYFIIIGFCYPLTAISNVFSMGSRSARNPKLGMICSSIALVVNIILNYGLIFGKLGFPEMGVRGSAIATVIARIVELSLLISYVYFIKENYVLKFMIKDIKAITKDFVKVFLSKATPVFLNDGIWAFGTVLYSIAYAEAGTSAMAASQIASSTGNFFITTAVCIAIGSSIMLGNELGADNIKKALLYSKKFSALVSIAGAIFGVLLIVCIPVLLKVFNAPESLAPDLVKIFIIMGVLMALKTFNTFIVIGVLRSGGDTKYALFLEMGCMWLLSLPLTFYAAHKGLPIYILVALTYTEELAKFVFGVPRALSKKWARNIVKDI